MREQQNSTTKQKQQIIEKLEQTIKGLKMELSKEKCVNENLQKDINEKQAEIEKLIDVSPQNNKTNMVR